MKTKHPNTYTLTAPDGATFANLSIENAWSHVLHCESVTEGEDVRGYMGFATDDCGAETFMDFWEEFNWRLERTNAAGVKRYARALWRNMIWDYRNEHDEGVSLAMARRMWRDARRDAQFAADMIEGRVS